MPNQVTNATSRSLRFARHFNHLPESRSDDELLSVPFLISGLSRFSLFVPGFFPFDPVYCLTWMCLDVLFCTASIMHLCTISVDRYLSLRYPMKFGRNKTRRRVVLKIMFVWLLSVAMSLPLSLMYSQVSFFQFETSACITHSLVHQSHSECAFQRILHVFCFPSFLWGCPLAEFNIQLIFSLYPVFLQRHFSKDGSLKYVRSNWLPVLLHVGCFFLRYSPQCVSIFYSVCQFNHLHLSPVIHFSRLLML